MPPKKERSVRIRRSRLSDVPQIYACQEAAYQNYGSGGLCDERLLTLQIEAFPEGQLVAVYRGRVVGYAITLFTYSSFLALPTLYLEDLFVLESHRGQGAGYRLFTHCVEEAHRRGCGRMEWQVLDWNRLAIDFYERLGARQMKEWLPYRMVREDMEALLSKKRAGQASG